MRLLLLTFIAACLFPVSLFAATKQRKIDLRYRSVAEATEEVARQYGAAGTSAILSTNKKHNTVTLRLNSPYAAKVGAFLTSIDHKREQVQLRMNIIRKKKATAGLPAEEETLASPFMLGVPGKPMIVSFEKDGETFRVEVEATVLKP